jgi:hypothetical protein
MKRTGCDGEKSRTSTRVNSIGRTVEMDSNGTSVDLNFGEIEGINWANCEQTLIEAQKE